MRRSSTVNANPVWAHTLLPVSRNRGVEKEWGPTEVVLYLDNNSVQKELYGGKLTENLTQAVARDLLANAIFNVEAHGYRGVLYVHDELVAEVPEGFGSVMELCDLMCRLPPWAAGLPLKAEGGARKAVSQVGCP